MYGTYSFDLKHILNFNMIFRFLYNVEIIQSLRQFLFNFNEHIFLNRKIRIVKKFIKFVNFVHTFNFVYKNIRSKLIFCFKNANFD